MQTRIDFWNEGIKKMHTGHCAKILDLLKKKEWVATRTIMIETGSMNHTARIANLRNGKHDGNKYIIEAVKNEVGVNGYRLNGWVKPSRV